MDVGRARLPAALSLGCPGSGDAPRGAGLGWGVMETQGRDGEAQRGF